MMAKQDFYGNVQQVAAHDIYNVRVGRDAHTLRRRMRRHAALCDVARRRQIWNAWNFARVPLIVAVLAYAYAMLRFDASTPFPGWQALGMLMVACASCIVLVGLGRVRRRCMAVRHRQQAYIAAIRWWLAGM